VKELVIATRNRGKMREIEAFLSGLVEKVSCAADFADFPETVEDCDTFELNALKKAREAMLFSGLPALADDSGLVVDALDGRPGVYSARFAGEDTDDAANNRKLLEELMNVPPESRQCAFVCAMAFVATDGREQVFVERVGGSVLLQERGSGGFGYDPLFLVDEFGRSMAELTIGEKNLISHRGQALKKFRDYLETLK
jgi:XTP/dITP diphosphohydrolase